MKQLATLQNMDKKRIRNIIKIKQRHIRLDSLGFKMKRLSSADNP
ncbi:Uncharacterised protein [Mycobacteroides abscessus subsp. abscessus]|nr:Uncharacterised protein [Mycobacteroides abscessus subsp. abscessus]